MRHSSVDVALRGEGRSDETRAETIYASGCRGARRLASGPFSTACAIECFSMLLVVAAQSVVERLGEIDTRHLLEHVLA